MNLLFLAILLVVSVASIYGFSGVTISDAIDMAVLHDGELANLRREAKLLDGDAIVAVSSYIPTINFSYSKSERANPDAADERSQRLSVSARQQIFDGGVSVNELQSIEDRRTVFSLRYRERMNAVIVDTMISYLAALRERQNVSIYRQTLESSRNEFAVAEVRYELGELTRDELLERQLSLSSLEISYIEAEEAYLLARRALASLTGGEKESAEFLPPAEISGAINMDYRTMLIDDPNFYVANATARDVDLAELTIRMEQLRRSGGISILLPEVAVDVNLGFAGAGSSPIANPDLSIGIQAALDIPFFPITAEAEIGGILLARPSFRFGISSGFSNGVASLRDRERITANMDTIVAQYEAMSDQIADRARNSLLRIDIQRKRVEHTVERLDLLDSRFAIMRIRAELGEVRDAELIEVAIEIANTRSSIAEEIVALFGMEVGMLMMIDDEGLVDSHRHIISYGSL